MSVELIIKQEEVKEEVVRLLSSVKRKGMKHFIDSLDELGYFSAPASSQHHLSYDGGLAEHSLNVYNHMISIAEALDYESLGITKDSIIMSGLLHDFGKAKFNGKEEYIDNILKSGKRSDAKPYMKNKERPPIAHEVTGLLSLAKYIDITDEEATAMLYHNGAYTPIWREVQNKEQPLQLLLHYADLWVSRFVESKGFEESEG